VTQLTVGSCAPAFELPDTDGRRVAFLPESPGLKILVFYKNTCPTCQFAMPYFDRLYTRLGREGAQIYAVAQDTAQEARDFARAYDLKMPQLVDAAPYAVSRSYRLLNVPTLFVVDAAGRIVLASPAFFKAHLLEAGELLAHETGTGPARLFDPGEDVPELKPG
jgi:peroxiredoxin